MGQLLLLKRREVSCIRIVSSESSTSVFKGVKNRAEIANSSFVKRLMDVILASVLFVFVFSWLFPLIALVIKLTSKGPVFFKQERTGLDKQKIICYKFRSMNVESCNIGAAGKYCQVVKNDVRVTKVGCFLRKTSLDEFPQFWNVLIGDMSIVGPRPHPVALDRESEQIITNYNLRHLVKPGITGIAQVKGYRGQTRELDLMQKRINHDIWYIKHWDFFLDVKIMLLTVRCILRGDINAY
jgi:putative colanic acid biosynthesis UDP-glucose lipid carrier transferase